MACFKMGVDVCRQIQGTYSSRWLFQLFCSSETRFNYEFYTLSFVPDKLKCISELACENSRLSSDSLSGGLKAGGFESRPM